MLPVFRAESPSGDVKSVVTCVVFEALPCLLYPGAGFHAARILPPMGGISLSMRKDL